MRELFKNKYRIKSARLADKYWQEIPQHFKNIILDEYVIMPNHIHGIIIIDNEKNVATNVDFII